MTRVKSNEESYAIARCPLLGDKGRLDRCVNSEKIHTDLHLHYVGLIDADHEPRTPIRIALVDSFSVDIGVYAP